MNEQTSPNIAEQPIFRALLVPYRSLGSSGFAVVMSVLLIAWATGSVIFLARGAWPVVAFLSLVVAAVYVAFRFNYRAGRRQEDEETDRARKAMDESDGKPPEYRD